MIPAAFITEWQMLSAPWLQPDDVEQDLIICRTLVELFKDVDIARRLAFRGGTALYKLYLQPAPRYSEDIDLVQVTAEPIGSTIDYIHNILDPWLGKPNYDQKKQSYTLRYRFNSESRTSKRLKVEINSREHATEIGLSKRPFSVNSRWFSDSALITTFSLAELLGTKLRALYQRKKGRDLFDLDYALRNSDVDPVEVVTMFVRYVSAQGLHISTSEFKANLESKRKDNQFRQDIIPLLRQSVKYDVDEAVTKIDTLLIKHIDSAWD